MLTDLANQFIYVSHPDFMTELCEELGTVTAIHGNLVFSSINKPDICFAQDRWLDYQLVHISSIGEAANILKQQKAIWHPNIIQCARRSLFIAEKIPLYRNKPLTFPLTRVLPNIQCYSLLNETTLIYSLKRLKNTPNGEYFFQEDKVNPPNRAYLKLWEALSILNHYPSTETTVLDLGAAPGGWTYVMQSLGAKVIAVDKAPLDANISQLTGVTSLQQSGFSLMPQDFPDVDWLVCDIACYPERLYTFLQKWLLTSNVKQYICTIKLQGKTDFEIIRRFQAIPNSLVLHLFNNKHELTWIYPVITA